MVRMQNSPKYLVKEDEKIAAAKNAELLLSLSSRIAASFRVLRRFLKHIKSRLLDPRGQIAISEDCSCYVGARKDQKRTLQEWGKFDSEFYRLAYPHSQGLDPYFHYINFGKNEGCLPHAPILQGLKGFKKTIDQSKATVMIISHDASRSGAPILSLNIAQQFKIKYNVIVCLLRGGELLAEFQKQCDLVISQPQAHNNYIFSVILDRLEHETTIKFAIVNSIVSGSILPALASHFIPSLCLVHEFASYIRPKNLFHQALLWASELVFSAKIVCENAADNYGILIERQAVILPQGKCLVPLCCTKTDSEKTIDKSEIKKLFRPDAFAESAVVILGVGTVELRKGVDIFLACAARVVALSPSFTLRFVWVGPGFDPDNDAVYSAFLLDQIQRSGLEDVFCFVGEMDDIGIAYDLSDVLFLSSRLDPLPNVAIDAMYKQLPVVCFDGTTGIADLLKENGFGESCVISYLDVEQAAQKLVLLINDAEKRKRLGYQINELAKRLFDMKSYVDALELRALDCVAMQETEKRNCKAIEEGNALLLDYYCSPTWGPMSYKEAVRTFVRTWRSGIDLRRPFPGFHPGIYKELHGLSLADSNPMAEYITEGKPQGPWMADLEVPKSPGKNQEKQQLRVALHIHVFFADLLNDLLQRLENQDLHLDLLMSVPSSSVSGEVESMTRGYTNGVVDIRIVPNRGRDIGPLFTEFSEIIMKNYDVIGHFHTKKSGDVKDQAIGKIWFNFLLENLLGGKHPMASIILERMAGNEKLGLVYPDDPYVVGWCANKQIAENLAQQLGIEELPRKYFNFPVGTMFWARTMALQPLFCKGYTWEDYPVEPLPYDGTMLHALERLLPFVVKKQGYEEILTYVPGVTR